MSYTSEEIDEATIVKSPCFAQCGNCLQCWDGSIRCELTFNEATELCNDQAEGHARIYDPRIEKRQQVKDVLTQRIKKTTVKEPKPVKESKPVKEPKEIKPIQGGLF